MKKTPRQKIIVAAAFASLAAVSISAIAWTVDAPNKVLTSVGTHVGTFGYVGIEGGIHANCLNQVLYFDIATPIGKSMQTLLLTAKVAGQKVRIGYSPGATVAVCYLELAEIQ